MLGHEIVRTLAQGSRSKLALFQYVVTILFITIRHPVLCTQLNSATRLAYTPQSGPNGYSGLVSGEKMPREYCFSSFPRPAKLDLYTKNNLSLGDR